MSQARLAEALGMTRARLTTLETSGAYVLPTDHFADEWMNKVQAVSNING